MKKIVARILPSSGKDLFPDDWAMGQGTDDNMFACSTIPIAYAKAGSAGAQHEKFHVAATPRHFQGNQTYSYQVKIDH